MPRAPTPGPWYWRGAGRMREVRFRLAFAFPRVFGPRAVATNVGGFAVSSVRLVAGRCRVLIEGYASGSRSERGIVQEAVHELFCPADTAPRVIPEG